MLVVVVVIPAPLWPAPLSPAQVNFRQFVADECVIDPRARIRFATFYKWYSTIIDNPLPKRAIRHNLPDTCGVVAGTANIRYVAGLRFKRE